MLRLLTAFYLLFHAVKGYPDTPLPLNGIVSLVGYAPDTIFQTLDYIPVCGTLGPSLTSATGITTYCDPAMSVFNKTANLVAMFDQTGVLLPLTPASGQSGCLCFCLSMLSGRQGNLCLWLEAGAVPQVWWGGNYLDASTYQPGTKSLPQCADVNLPALSSSIYAHLPPLTTLVTVIAGVSTTVTVPKPTSQFSAIPPVGTATSGSPNTGSSNTGSSGSGSPGNNVVAIVSIVVASVISLAIIAAVTFYCVKKNRLRGPQAQPPLSQPPNQTSGNGPNPPYSYITSLEEPTKKARFLR
jgi:hypothetical protein